MDRNDLFFVMGQTVVPVSNEGDVLTKMGDAARSAEAIYAKEPVRYHGFFSAGEEARKEIGRQLARQGYAPKFLRFTGTHFSGYEIRDL